MDELREEFRKVYDQHGIRVVGRWKSIEHPHESYYMATYDSYDEYQDKIDALHADEHYLNLTSQINLIRTEFKAIKLRPQ
ncbi:MAG: hypothetical protein ACFFEE_07880 [Candidatus Thorarchaeota archaeon]